MTSLRSVADRLMPDPALSSEPAAVYHALLREPKNVDAQLIRSFLAEQIAMAERYVNPLPDDFNGLTEWVEKNASNVASEYREYLEGRRSGRDRSFFSSKAHALYFLKHVAPTKLVDGAWLYSSIRHAQDWRYRDLIRTYLEELGDGEPGLNHVVLYRKLLADHDCAPIEILSQEHYVQGAIQLALGHLGDEYLPELLGYNLGYEQLPLHLLITAFELNELGIDPYYFTLHVTIDNASIGHAYKAVKSLVDLIPSDATRDDFLARLRNGYLLNELGKGTKAVISSFDLEQEVVAMLERKRSFGQHMHSDYCRLEGQTVNEWLAEPGRCRAFLSALENKGWIKRHQDPVNSRFWQLIDGPGAVMFGVFSGYEMQLLRDWIAGDFQGSDPSKKLNPFRAQFRNRPKTNASSDASLSQSDDSTLHIIELLSPSHHSTPEGLLATRTYAQQFSEGSLSL